MTPPPLDATRGGERSPPRRTPPAPALATCAAFHSHRCPSRRFLPSLQRRLGLYVATTPDPEPRAVVAMAVAVYPALARVVPPAPMVYLPVRAPRLLRGPRREGREGRHDLLDALAHYFQGGIRRRGKNAVRFVLGDAYPSSC